MSRSAEEIQRAMEEVRNLPQDEQFSVMEKLMAEADQLSPETDWPSIARKIADDAKTAHLSRSTRPASDSRPPR